VRTVLRIFSHLLIALLLTALTQVGGAVYLIFLPILKKAQSWWKKLLLFLGIYLLTTFLVIPPLARINGREPVKHSEVIDCHNWLTFLLNRNYVTPKMNSMLQSSAKKIRSAYPELKLIYFDANFPFFNGFPLLPHLSHDDGKKIDLALMYKDEAGKLTNQKKSVSGYGVFVPVKSGEENRALQCKNSGYWQYEFSKYFSFGYIHSDLVLDEKATKVLINSILVQPEVEKIFLEPHLKQRMKLANPKIRFHGCHSVRHDDHIHVEIK